MAGCSICAHPKRAAIDLALLNGGSIRVTAAQFGFADFSAMARHSRKHLPNVLAKVALQTEAEVRLAFGPEMDVVLGALMTLYQQLCVGCRSHVLEAIKALEGQRDECVARVEVAHRESRPVRVDRPARPAKRVKPAIRAVPPPESDLKYMF